MARVLVVGASGLLGGELVLSARQEHTVVAVSVNSPIEPPAGVTALRADCTQPGVAEALVRDVRPDWIINAAAATDVDALEANPERAERLNHHLPAALAVASRSVDARFVHVSTDLVFDGRSTAPYCEDDLPAPVNTYGRSKLNGERAVLAALSDAIVTRTTIYGWNTMLKMSLAEWFLSRLEAGMEAPGFVDAWFTPINTAHLAAAIFALLDGNAPGGVIHVAGSECISKFDFGRRIAAAFGCDPSLVRPDHLMNHVFPAQRAGWACLESSRAAAFLGVPAPSVDAGLARFRDDHDNGRRAALRRMGGNA